MSGPTFTATFYGVAQKTQAARIDRLERELAEVKARELELERICEETYCATGADAYYHCCEQTEVWDAERLKKGLAPIYGPGEGRSLCGWIDSIRELLEDAEARAIPDGWVPVPVEPTEMMTQAAINHIMQNIISLRNIKRALSLAIAARPQSPGESNVE